MLEPSISGPNPDEILMGAATPELQIPGLGRPSALIELSLVTFELVGAGPTVTVVIGTPLVTIGPLAGAELVGLKVHILEVHVAGIEESVDHAVTIIKLDSTERYPMATSPGRSVARTVVVCDVSLALLPLLSLLPVDVTTDADATPPPALVVSGPPCLAFSTKEKILASRTLLEVCADACVIPPIVKRPPVKTVIATTKTRRFR